MRFVALLLAVMALVPAGQAQSEADPLIAILREDSGSLPPEYAWNYRVRFFASGKVTAVYCKGYAEAEPGCATVQKALSADARTAMAGELAEKAAGLDQAPPRTLPDHQIPIGGGSVGGWILVNGAEVDLTEFPVPEDAAKVAELIGILQKYTPKNLIKKAERRAKQP